VPTSTKSDPYAFAPNVGYRVAALQGKPGWVVKQGPAWRIVFRGESLEDCAGWLISLKVNAADVPLLDGNPEGSTVAAYLRSAGTVTTALLKAAAHLSAPDLQAEIDHLLSKGGRV
jgi:hypothetical protein